MMPVTPQPAQAAPARPSWSKLLQNPLVQYALAGAATGGGMSFLNSFMKNRPVRGAMGSGIGSTILGGLLGAGGYGLANAAGYTPPTIMNLGNQAVSAGQAGVNTVKSYFNKGASAVDTKALIAACLEKRASAEKKAAIGAVLKKLVAPINPIETREKIKDLAPLGPRITARISKAKSFDQLTSNLSRYRALTQKLKAQQKRRTMGLGAVGLGGASGVAGIATALSGNDSGDDQETN